MSTIETIDPVFKMVQQSVRQFGLDDNAPVGQQILLLGDMFYGYRFTSNGFTAVWSASNRILTVFDRDGRQLGTTYLEVETDEWYDEDTTIRIPQQRQTALPARSAA